MLAQILSDIYSAISKVQKIERRNYFHACEISHAYQERERLRNEQENQLKK